jgi:hypothetical protein
MKRFKYITILLSVVMTLPTMAQEGEVNSLLDEFLFGSSSRDSVLEAAVMNDADLNDLTNALSGNRFIYAKSEFENKTFFMGQDLGIKQYNISNQLLYSGPKGLNIIVSGLLYSGFQPQYNTTIATIGYNNTLGKLKNLRLRASYSRFFFAKNDSIPESDFNSSFNLGATYQRKFIGTSADISILTGNQPSVQASWDVFTDFTLARFGLFSKLGFNPEASLYFGNEIVITSQYISTRKQTVEVTSENNTFGLLNTMIRVPLSFTYRNFDLIAGYNFNFPRSPGTDIKPANTSFFNISVGYIINF